jgi:class 3 adenylate cyclase/tetratricopeptide (TPR) repeat protein
MDARSEIRLVTCLFIDLVGSTDATARLGPERMQRLLGDVFTQMSTSIAAHGGRVEKYIGDAILALFGAPVSHADDAHRALRAAEACLDWTSGSSLPDAGLTVRAGIETGEVLVDLDAVEVGERMVVGDAVNLAARLQQAAEPGQIVVGPTSHGVLAEVAEFEPLGPLSMKGLGAIEAWRFLHMRDAISAPAVEFVGRDSELASLHDAFKRAFANTAILALIVGPPGNGKSRLVGEAIARSGPPRVLEARCRPGTETGANSPLRQLVEADVAGATADGVHRRVSDLIDGSDAADVAAAITHAAGLAVDERLLAISRYEQREVIAAAWRRYLAALAREGPLAIFADDVHWADPLFLRVIDHVTTDLAAPLVVLATARPEFVGSAHLRPRDDRVHIDLGPLDGPDVERLVRLVGNGAPAGTASIERAGGNPLFIIELARSRARPTELPVTIQAAIAARLDELSASERDLLQRTSVAGETFDVHAAALLGDREPGEVAGALGRVAHLGFVTPIGTSYRFHHGLVRDVAYGRLPVAERMALHARYAVEGLDPSDVEAQAHHWWEALRPPDAEWVWDDAGRLGQMRRDACRIHLAAGERLEERNVYEEALEVYVRAARLADETADRAMAEAAIGRASARQGLGDDAWAHRLRAIDLFTEAGTEPPALLYADMLEIAAFNWGYFQHLPEDDQVLRLFEDGLRVARTSGDDVAEARLLAQRASYAGDLDGTEEIGRFVESADAARFADASQRMATVYLWQGRVSEAIRLFETVFDRLIPAGAVINSPEALAWYGLAAYTAGNLARADRIADRLLAESRQRSVHTRSHAHALKAMVLFGRGNWAALKGTMRELTALVEGNPDASFCVLGAAAAGYGAAADVLAGEALPADIDGRAKRLVDDSERVQAASVMLAKVMAGDSSALRSGLRGYEPGLRLWDRYRVWDVADIVPGIALTMLERWDDLPAVLARLDEFSTGGARLPEAVAAAIREERAATDGGPAAAHELLLALGYAGIGALLRFRPVRPVAA